MLYLRLAQVFWLVILNGKKTDLALHFRQGVGKGHRLAPRDCAAREIRAPVGSVAPGLPSYSYDRRPAALFFYAGNATTQLVGDLAAITVVELADED